MLRVIPNVVAGLVWIVVDQSAQYLILLSMHKSFMSKLGLLPNSTPTDYYINRTGIAPSLLLVDTDKSQFKTAELFELSSTKTYSNFKEILGSQPTQLWTGGGNPGTVQSSSGLKM